MKSKREGIERPLISIIQLNKERKNRYNSRMECSSPLKAHSYISTVSEKHSQWSTNIFGKETCNRCADIRESCPMETLKRREPSAFFFSTNHPAKAAAIASATCSVRLTGSPSTPATATPRISLYKATSTHKWHQSGQSKYAC